MVTLETRRLPTDLSAHIDVHRRKANHHWRSAALHRSNAPDRGNGCLGKRAGLDGPRCAQRCRGDCHEDIF